MNKKDRKEIAQKLGKMQELLAQIEAMRDFLDEKTSAEEEKYDNICERGFESSPTGEWIEESMQALEEAFTQIDEAHTGLEGAITTLEGAIE